MTVALSDQVVFVSGAGKGLGRAFALDLLRSGASVAACSRGEADLETLKDEAGPNGQLLTACLDVRDFEALKGFVQAIDGRFGRLDAAIVNAGVTTENATVEDSDLDKWSQALEINLLGALKTAKAVIPLLKRRGGQVVFVGSGLGHRAVPGTSSYACSKAGLWMLTRVLASELAADGILVNELIPGPVRTEIDRRIVTRHSSATFSSEWTKDPDDVLPLLRYLLSFPAQGPTGQTFSLARREL